MKSKREAIRRTIHTTNLDGKFLNVKTFIIKVTKNLNNLDYLGFSK